MADSMNWWSLLATLIAGITIFWVQRQASAADKERDKSEARMSKMEDRMAAMEMKVVSEIPDREDYHDLSRRVESVAATLAEVRDIVIRMEARNK
ncbi:hypothetical protein [Stenotrophomonas phage SOVA965]